MSLPITLPTSRIEPAAEAPVLRWGIMGPGWIAERFIESVRAHTRQDIVAVGSRDKKRAEEFASRMGLQQAYGEYFTPDHRIFDPKLAGGPLLDLGTYPVSLITDIWVFPHKSSALGRRIPKALPASFQLS